MSNTRFHYDVKINGVLYQLYECNNAGYTTDILMKPTRIREKLFFNYIRKEYDEVIRYKEDLESITFYRNDKILFTKVYYSIAE